MATNPINQGPITHGPAITSPIGRSQNSRWFLNVAMALAVSLMVCAQKPRVALPVGIAVFVRFLPGLAKLKIQRSLKSEGHWYDMMVVKLDAPRSHLQVGTAASI
jgi:hypothetical protein